MDAPARPDDALAQPTRARLFSLLGEIRRPAGTEELAERLDLHPNGVRVHLERLRDAGLVVRERTRQAQGRPRDLWLIALDARPGGEGPSGYAGLGGWLARAMSPGRTSLRAVGATGREIGRELAPGGDYAACPYRDAVRESPDLVRALHRGVTRGLLDALAPETKLAGFVARDPYRAGCLVELQGGLAVEGANRLREAGAR